MGKLSCQGNEDLIHLSDFFELRDDKQISIETLIKITV